MALEWHLWSRSASECEWEWEQGQEIPVHEPSSSVLGLSLGGLTEGLVDPGLEKLPVQLGEDVRLGGGGEAGAQHLEG